MDTIYDVIPAQEIRHNTLTDYERITQRYKDYETEN